MSEWKIITESRGNEVWSVAKHTDNPLMNIEHRVCVCTMPEQAAYISDVLNEHDKKDANK